MGTITRGTKSAGGTAFVDDTTIEAAEFNTDFDNAYNEINGNLDDNNIDSISSSKISDATATGTSLLTAASAAAARTTLDVVQEAEIPARNLLSNGDFGVWQRGTSFNATTTPANDNDTYLADRWLLLSDGNDAVDVSQETSTVPAGSRGAIKLDVETANKKFGIVQILENEDSLPLRSATLSLSFKARVTGTSITKIRAGVAEWTGTADTVTSDLVSAWGADEANPTLDTSWAFSDTPAALTALTTSYQTYEIEGITTGSGVNNLAVFIWMNSIDGSNPTVGDFLYISDIQLEIGAGSKEFHHKPIGQELRECQRYFCKTFDQGVAPAQATSDTNGAIEAISAGTGAGTVNAIWEFPVTMRTAPTVTTYNPAASASSWRRSDATNVAATTDNLGDRAVRVASNAATTDATAHEIHVAADAEL